MTFKYNGSTIVPGDQGVDYETFKRKCTGKLPLPAFGTSGIPCCPGQRGRRWEKTWGRKLQFVPPLLPRALSRMAGSSAVTESNSLKSLQSFVSPLALRSSRLFFSPLSTICRSFPAINKSRGWLSKAPIVRHCSSKAQPLAGERRNAPFRGLEKRSRTEYSAIKSFCKPCSSCSSNRGQKVAQIF